ncbi:MAG: YtxH domain-containing protein [Desulfamplus sp.]|nr:YtxH domain-containing protein [Desulfamplus sp.]
MYNYNQYNPTNHSGCSDSAHASNYPNQPQETHHHHPAGAANQIPPQGVGVNQPVYYQNGYYQTTYDDAPVFYHSQQFWKGIAIGAIATIFITNETLQKAVMKGAIKFYDTVQSGAYELKEKFEDVQAELRQKAGEEK